MITFMIGFVTVSDSNDYMLVRQYRHVVYSLVVVLSLDINFIHDHDCSHICHMISL
jgi:hypothetical protein